MVVAMLVLLLASLRTFLGALSFGLFSSKLLLEIVEPVHCRRNTQIEAGPMIR
jgi:hypothetical protein